MIEIAGKLVEGTLINEAQYKDFFFNLQSNLMFSQITYEPTAHINVSSNGWFSCYYAVTIDFKANTTGQERQTYIYPAYVEVVNGSAMAGATAMPVKIVQSK